jgi:RNA polymerase sigma-70 factor (ECF subfamily)
MGGEDSGEPSSLGEAAALTTQLEAHRARLLAMLRRRIDPRLAPRLDPEDLLHEVYFVARRRWAGFDPNTMSPYAWLYRIALDTLLEAWRRENRNGRDPRRQMPWPDRSSAQMAIGLMGSLTSPSVAVARDELRERVRQALDGLKPTDREVLWMRHFDDLPFRDIALILGVSDEAAMQRYSRALRRLKALWQTLFERGESQS